MVQTDRHADGQPDSLTAVVDVFTDTANGNITINNNNNNIVHIYNALNDALSANRIYIIYPIKTTILYTYKTQNLLTTH